MDAAYAFCLVLANFGIAIAARMPMITTTINSSMSVKPLRFTCSSSQEGLTPRRARLARAGSGARVWLRRGVGLRTIETTRYGAVGRARGGSSTTTVFYCKGTSPDVAGNVSGVTGHQENPYTMSHPGTGAGWRSAFDEKQTGRSVGSAPP